MWRPGAIVPTIRAPRSRLGAVTSGTFTLTMNDPNSAACKHHAGQTSDAVARDQVVDRVADLAWDEVEHPRPLPVRKLARNAQRGFGFDIGLAGRDEREGIRAVRIDAELFGERTTFGQLDRNVAKVAAAITFADETATARA